MERPEKIKEVAHLEGMFASAQVAVCSDYRGLTVEQVTQLRRELRAKGATSKVVKNSLARIASHKALAGARGGEAEYSKFKDLLKGPNLIVFSDADPVSPTKVLADFAKKNTKLRLRGAWFESTCLDEQGVLNLASMPSREETLGTVVGLMTAPASRVASMLQAPGAQLVRLLEAHVANLQKAEAAG